VDAVYQQVREEFRLRGCHILTPAEKKKVDPVIAVDGHLNPAIIGQLPVMFFCFLPNRSITTKP
jgi:hypothetical protein